MPVGRPDAGKPNVRFDERGRKRSGRSVATAPVLDFTALMLKIVRGRGEPAVPAQIYCGSILRDPDVVGPLGPLLAVLLGALRQIELARRQRELLDQPLVDPGEKIASLISMFSRCLIASGTAFGTAIARKPVLTKPG